MSNFKNIALGRLLLAYFLVALTFFGGLVHAANSEAVRVYELKGADAGYTLVLINREDRTVKSAYIEHFIAGILTGMRLWYLDLHKDRGSFTDEERIRKDFEFGTERLEDKRSIYAILLKGEPEIIFADIVDRGSLNPDLVRATVRLTTASKQDPRPPFFHRLGRLPEGFPNIHDRKDWGELKNLGVDPRLGFDAIPLVLAGLDKSGWGDQGGYLYERKTGQFLLTGDSRVLSGEPEELEDAYELYHQNDLMQKEQGIDADQFESIRISDYYLEFLVPASEAEGLEDPRKAKGLLAYYLRNGFKLVDVNKDPNQPGTLIAVVWASRAVWAQIVDKTFRRRGREFMAWPMDIVNYDNPHTLKKAASSPCEILLSDKTGSDD
jgi:hypothetical protein